MRTKLAVIFWVLFLSAHCLYAQTDSLSTKKISLHYFNSFLSGGLFGDEQKVTNFSFNTTHGLRWKRWGVGINIGFDSYPGWRVMPYYGSLSFDFGRIKTSNALFLEFDLGCAKAWYTGRTDWLPEYNVKGGTALMALMGYRIKADKFNLYFKAGYKFQRIGYSYNLHYEGWGGNPGWTYHYSVEQDIERLVVLIGFGW